MNEKRERGGNAGAWVALSLGVLGALVFAIWQIGPGTLRNLAYIVVIGLMAAVVIVAVAFPIRMWRRQDYVGERETHHYYHDGTRVVEKHTIDGRTVEPKLYQLPAGQQGAAFPELLRASYAAGMLAAPRTASRDERSQAADYREYDEWDEGETIRPVTDGWQGPINQ